MADSQVGTVVLPWVTQPTLASATTRRPVQSCVACHGEKVVVLAPQVKDRKEFAVVGCCRCGLGRLDPLPTTGVEEYYGCMYQEEKNPGQDSRTVRAQPIKQRDTERRWSQLAHLLLKGTRVLDIGCGSGGFLHAARVCSEATLSAIEPHETFRTQLLQEGFDVRRSLSDCSDEVYDLIVLFHVLEHVVDPLGLLRTIAPRLKSGGRLVIEVPSMTDALLWVYKIPAFWNFYWQFPHIWYFSLAPLRQILEACGYQATITPVQRYGLLNHLQWLREGTPGSGDQFSKFVSTEMEEEYCARVKAAGAYDTLWAECQVGPCVG